MPQAFHRKPKAIPGYVCKYCGVTTDYSYTCDACKEKRMLKKRFSLIIKELK